MAAQSSLLAEVPDLVEFPAVVAGAFSAEFLQLPQEVLITTLIHHQHYFPVVGATGAVGREMLKTLAERKFPSIIIHPKTSLYSLDFHAEQEPNRDSRVTLADAVDELGLRRIRVDWRYTSGDVRTVQRALELLAHDLRESGVGSFDYDSADVEAEMTRYGAYGGHHIGTARMHRDPSQGVVDADGRVHGVDNLYVAGSAVFPTSSQANPTFTIVALAARLAAHLRVRARGAE